MLTVWMVLAIVAPSGTWEIVETDSGIYVQDSSVDDPTIHQKYEVPQVEKCKLQKGQIPSLKAGNEIILDEEGMVIYDFPSIEDNATSDFPAEEYAQFIKDAMQSLKKTECSNPWLFEPDPEYQPVSMKEDSIEDYRKFIREAVNFLKEIEYSHQKIMESVQSPTQKYNEKTVYQKPAKSHNEIMEDYEMFIFKILNSLKEIENKYGCILEPDSTKQKAESATPWMSLKKVFELVQVLFLILILVYVFCLFNQIRLIDCMVREFKARLDLLESVLLKSQEEVRHSRIPIYQRPDTGDDAL